MPEKLFLPARSALYSSFFLGQSKQPNTAFHTDCFNAEDHWVVLPKRAIREVSKPENNWKNNTKRRYSFY